MLALVLCTSERCTGTWAHMLWFKCKLVTRSVSLDAAVIDDLAAEHIHHQLMTFYDRL